jgi:uncharacterized membrane protein
MWFKTRIGICCLTDSAEILVNKNQKRDIWFIYARRRAFAPLTSMFWFGKNSERPAVLVLAQFIDSPTASAAIAKCMEQIETAIRTKAELCDLSQLGDAQAWGSGWTQIQWPNKQA